jgi:methionyl aminopeptidase
MRVSGKIAARICSEIATRVSPGVTTAELDGYAAELIRANGAASSFLGYRGFPGHICLSVNEEVVHGVPGKRRIELGDIVSIDVGVEYDGYIGDTAVTVMVGVTDLQLVSLVRTAEKALEAGIEAARPGNHVSDISNAIECAVVPAGFSVVREFVGHGVGRRMHEDPQIPNFGPPGKGAVLRPGMTLALEPMVNRGVSGVAVGTDGWTVRTADGKPSAHFEHTIAVREGAAEILTCRPGR